MKQVLPVLMLVAVALAGCEEGGDGGPGTTTTSTTSGTGGTFTTSTTTTGAGPFVPGTIPLLLNFRIDGCTGLSIGALASLDAIQQRLPEGYTASAAPDPYGSPGFGVAIVDLYSCTNFSTPVVDIGATWFGHAYTYIEDPGRGVEADVHEYVFEVLADQDILAQLWNVAGYTTRNSTAAMEDTDPTNPVSTLRARTLSTGGYELQAAGPATGGTSIGPQTFVRYTALEDGRVLQWNGTQELPGTFDALGTYTVPADSAFAGLGTGSPNRLEGFAIATDGASFTGQDLLLFLAPA